MQEYRDDGAELQTAPTALTIPRVRLPRVAAVWLACMLVAACGGGLVPVLNVQQAPVVLPRGG